MVSVQAIKIITLVLILVSTLASTLLPSVLRLTSGAKKKGRIGKVISIIEWFLHVSQGFAAGVLLSAGITHLLKENAEELHEAIHDLNWSEELTDFPWGHAAAVLAFTLFYLFETTTSGLLSFLIERKHSNHHHHKEHGSDEIVVEDSGFVGKRRNSTAENSALLKGSNAATYYSIERSVNVSESDSEDSVKWVHRKDSHDHHSHAIDFSGLEKQSFARAAISCFVLWLSLFSHSFIEGLSMGLQEELQNYATLLIAIMFHKLFAAYSLGVVVANAAAKAKSFFIFSISALLIVSFSIATPVGIAVGMIFSNTSFAEELWFRITSSSLLCAASGVFIFISIFELLFENAEHHGKYGNKLFTSFAFNVLFCAGVSGMIIVAYWT